MLDIGRMSSIHLVIFPKRIMGMENWSHHALLLGMENGATILEIGLTVSQKILNRANIGPRDSITKYLQERGKNIHPCKNLYTGA